MMVHSGSPFLAGLAGAKGSIDYWLHCSLGCREQTESRLALITYIQRVSVYLYSFRYGSVQCEAGYCVNIIILLYDNVLLQIECTCTTQDTSI